MFGKVIRDCVTLCACGVGLLYAWTNRFEIYEFVGLDSSQFAGAPENQAGETVKASMAAAVAPKPITSGTVSIRKSNDGHFWAQGQVNKAYVKFLVDTGASAIALTPEDAKKAGFKINKLTYDNPVMTANGQTMAARVTLKSVSVGGVRVNNVPALVVTDGLNVSLLGMSFLGELQKVEATRDVMILRR